MTPNGRTRQARSILKWRALSAFLSTLTAAALAACGSDGPAGPGATGPSLRILSGDGQQDTVDASVTLVLQVRDSDGRAPVGSPINFTASPVLLFEDTMPSVIVGDGRFDERRVTMSIPSDSFGVRVRMGPVQTAASLAIDVPSLGLSTTAHFTVVNGNPHALRVLPVDTVLYLGDGYTLSVALLDRRDVPRPASLTFEATGAVSVDSASVQSLEPGAGKIIVRGGGLVDTVDVTVVPAARMAGIKPALNSGQLPTVVSMNMNGTDRYELWRGEAHFQRLQVDLSPTDDQVVFYAQSMIGRGGSSPGGISVVRPKENATKILTPGVGNTFRDVYAPRYSPDGSWIYFVAMTSYQNGELWRIRPDGTAMSRVGPANPSDVIDSYPHVSPSGTRLVYLHNVVDTVDWNKKNNLRIWDLNSDNVVQSFDGQFIPMVPFWSNTGDEIAFVLLATYRGGRITVFDPATGSLRLTGQSDVQYEEIFSWAPSGRYVVAKPLDAPLEVLNVDTGKRIPLPFGADLSQPSLRPLR